MHSPRIKIVRAIENRILWRHQSALLSNRCVHSKLGGRALAVTAESNDAGDRKKTRIFGTCFVSFEEKEWVSCHNYDWDRSLKSCVMFWPSDSGAGTVFHLGFRLGKIPKPAPPSPKTWCKIWMTGLNPLNYAWLDWFPFCGGRIMKFQLEDEGAGLKHMLRNIELHRNQRQPLPTN